MKRILYLLAAVCLMAMLCVPVYAADSAGTPLKNFTYTVEPSGKLLLSKYNGKSAEVYIPGYYWVDGVKYPVELDALTIFRENETIQKVTLGENIGFSNNTAATLFAKCPNLRSVTAKNPNTAAVVSMEYMFTGCEKLTYVDLTGWDTGNVLTMRSMFSGCLELQTIRGYQKWDTKNLKNISFMFDNTRKLEKVDLRSWDLSALENSGWCFQICYAKEILLPDNIAIIGAGFLNHASKYTGSTYTVPSGVKTVGYAHTFYDFATNDFREFRVAQGNESLKAIDGILYTADGTKMLAIPRGKTFEDDTYYIPEGVSFLGELSFSRNYNVKKVVLPNSYLLKTVPLNDTAYITYDDIGNLNSGLNVNIAIYVYTGVTEYAVKEDNPNYQSLDGVIYSKDMTTLLAVPTRYQKNLNIPEGVQVWRSEAMWHGSKAVNGAMETSVVRIPASMTDIASDQLEKLNWLLENKSGFRVVVHEDNPVYYLDKSGLLAKRPHMEELDIQLNGEGIVYDGTPKTPEVTVTWQGKTLTKDKDYTLTYAENVQAGTAWVRISALSGFYGTVEHSFTIEKAMPEYTAPDHLTAIYGQRLQELSLPEGFRFAKPLQSVGDAGENTVHLTYTNSDMNYQTVEEIPVAITVQPKTLDLSGTVKISAQIWKGKPATPKLQIWDQGLAVPDSEYTVTYSQNKTFGRGKITIADHPGGNYTVSGTVYFWIVPDPLLVYLAVLTLLTALAFVQSVRVKKAALSGMLSKNR